MAFEAEEQAGATSNIYKMKVVQFLGRSVPIILQNDNGPCPLLAIINVLLLRSNVTLNLDMVEVSERDLMSLVAEWLLDANSKYQNIDEEFATNQQQNIGDAIQLLPRLATGIDVNVRFRHIHDFEFTPECAIFDLFHVGLVHGWLCDPQDEVTFKVIGSNSYNTLVEKLVALHGGIADEASPQPLVQEETAVGFGPAVGLQGPLVMRTLSIDNCGAWSKVDCKARKKEDNVETPELLLPVEPIQPHIRRGAATMFDNNLLTNMTRNKSILLHTNLVQQLETTSDMHFDTKKVESPVPENEGIITWPRDENELPADAEHIADLVVSSTLLVDNEGIKVAVPTEEVLLNDLVITAAESRMEGLLGDLVEEQVTTLQLLSKSHEEDTIGKKVLGFECADSSSSSIVPLLLSCSDGFQDTGGNRGTACIFTTGKDAKTVVACQRLDSLNVENQNVSIIENLGLLYEHDPSKAEYGECLWLNGKEPLFEGKCKSRISTIQDMDPLHDGESVSAGKMQMAGHEIDDHDIKMSQEEDLSVSAREGLIIENFLTNTASQLTYHGLFSLLDGLKNNELYIFFRNNHFSTLFKYEGQIYLLATDQGYLAQPDLVWEKLTQVDGDTVFATGNFTQFQADASSAIGNEFDGTSETLHHMDGSSYNSDLQLALALQQQEFGQQQLQLPSLVTCPDRSISRMSTVGASGLVTGSDRSNIPPPRQDKPKEKCTIM